MATDTRWIQLIINHDSNAGHEIPKVHCQSASFFTKLTMKLAPGSSLS